MPLVAVIMIFAIPILGILFAGYKEWLEFKAKHQDAGALSQEVTARLQALREQVETLEAEREALRERVQNLETIVTSESWIARHEESDDESLPSGAVDDLTLPDRDASADEAEHTARLAQRLRGE